MSVVLYQLLHRLRMRASQQLVVTVPAVGVITFTTALEISALEDTAEAAPVATVQVAVEPATLSVEPAPEVETTAVDPDVTSVSQVISMKFADPAT
jgi:hypothetical protein